MPALESNRRRPGKHKPRELPRPKKTKAQKQSDREKRPSLRRPGPRGWLGRGRGEASVIQPADEWRGTTVQVCGLHPFSVGTGTPMVGVPLGLQLFTGATVCADPISWFQGAGLLNFGMLVTATVIDAAHEADAKAAIDNLSATARLRLRIVHGSQDSAFAAALPLGLVLPRHLRIPSEVREQL